MLLHEHEFSTDVDIYASDYGHYQAPLCNVMYITVADLNVDGAVDGNYAYSLWLEWSPYESERDADKAKQTCIGSLSDLATLRPDDFQKIVLLDAASPLDLQIPKGDLVFIVLEGVGVKAIANNRNQNWPPDYYIYSSYSNTTQPTQECEP